MTVGSAEQLDVVGLTRGEGALVRAGAPRAGRVRGPDPGARRARSTCVASYDGQRLHVELRRPIRGVATGQAVVLYDGDTVLGSATITSTV